MGDAKRALKLLHQMRLHYQILSNPKHKRNLFLNYLVLHPQVDNQMITIHVEQAKSKRPPHSNNFKAQKAQRKPKALIFLALFHDSKRSLSKKITNFRNKQSNKTVKKSTKQQQTPTLALIQIQAPPNSRGIVGVKKEWKTAPLLSVAPNSMPRT